MNIDVSHVPRVSPKVCDYACTEHFCSRKLLTGDSNKRQLGVLVIGSGGHNNPQTIQNV